MRSLTLGLLALSLMGCADFGPGNALPEGAVVMVERPEFAALWSDVTACLGDSAKQRDRSRLSFYVVPNRDTLTLRDGRSVAGVYFARVKAIVFADLWSEGTLGASQPDYYRTPTIRHEFMHAQLGTESHPQWVLSLCGHLIHPETWRD